ncbi:hypothetical protein KYC5002_43165 [Archangium violaceum]|uniref:hypothetical protein n=1 Tax=Archangium violaceum TaxID=83451 RepID=UPI002B2B1CFE|nr:hypothetical protein KYC5002_43165 [Archangium gephyra]
MARLLNTLDSYVDVPFSIRPVAVKAPTDDKDRGVEAAGIEAAAGGFRRERYRVVESSFRRSSSRLRRPLPHAAGGGCWRT